MNKKTVCILSSDNAETWNNGDGSAAMECEWLAEKAAAMDYSRKSFIGKFFDWAFRLVKWI